MPRPKRSRVVKRHNALKRWQTNENNNSENQPSADTSVRIQYTSALNSGIVNKIEDIPDSSNYIIVDTENLSSLFTICCVVLVVVHP
ncbi:hypothetical protein AVEN_59391-1 [Araneus ventricosus]|uniref:Uncharacterized protein n=1 Tax=Araneus ventricosus TaxID=182803 RepID=A0A4Y2LJ77_ARAVE|nr:hypothetical protein AVEN_59391-1 [Araneus ventricosus]